MFGIWRRGVAPAVSALFVPAVATLVLLAAPVRAGDLDSAVNAPAQPTLFGAGPIELKPAPGELDDSATRSAVEEIEKVWLADFHPETDRWTERNNRIKVTLYGSALFFGQNLRIADDGGVGLRLSWEVPGFIGIRLDSTLVGWSHMRVRTANALDTQGNGTTATASVDHTRNMQGFVDVTSLSIAIFNPELSFAPNLAMWAGFGVDVWSYHYDELEPTLVPGTTAATMANARFYYVDFNVGGNFFFNLEYKIADMFHVGFEIREHIVYAPQTERGEFYKVDAGGAPGSNSPGVHTVGAPHSRNQGLPFALSAVHEFQLHISILF